MSELEERVRGLERQCRRMRWAAMGATVVAAVLAMGADARNEFAAGRFVVLDDSGRRRGELGWEDGDVSLRLYSSNDAKRPAVTVRPAGVYIASRRPGGGRTAVSLTVGHSDVFGDVAGLGMQRGDGQEVVRLWGTDKTALLMLRGENGEPWTAP